MPKAKIKELELPSPEEMPMSPWSYYILSFPVYGKFVFYGSEAEAYTLLYDTEAREGEKGRIRLADPASKKDKGLVRREIAGVAIDRLSNSELRPYPKEGWY